MYAQIISYVPSIIRRERLNIGVVVVDDTAVHVRVVDSAERLRHVDPGFDATHLSRRLQGLVLDVADLPALERTMARIDPTFEFSAPLRPSLSLPADEVMRVLFDRLVLFKEVAPTTANRRRARPKLHEERGNVFLHDVRRTITGKRGGPLSWERNVSLNEKSAERLFKVAQPPTVSRPLKMSLCVPNCSKVMVIEPLVKSWIDGSEAFAAATLFDYLGAMQTLSEKKIERVVLLLDAAERPDPKMVALATGLFEDHKIDIVRADEKTDVDWLSTRLKEYWLSPEELL